MEEGLQGKKDEQTAGGGMSNGGSERWNAALNNISEMGTTMDSLQKLLLRKAVYVDEEAFAQASANSIQSRNAVRGKLHSSPLNKAMRGIIFEIDLLWLKEQGQCGWAYSSVQGVIQDRTACQSPSPPPPAPPEDVTHKPEALERRVKTLERELDAAITAAARARAEKRQAEAAQRAAETRTQEVLRELEDTTKVFKLHMEELRAKQEEIGKKDGEIKVLQAIIQTLSGKGSSGSQGCIGLWQWWCTWHGYREALMDLQTLVGVADADVGMTELCWVLPWYGLYSYKCTQFGNIPILAYPRGRCAHPVMLGKA
eukprot:Gb_28299 [translate_table: standard]